MTTIAWKRIKEGYLVALDKKASAGENRFFLTKKYSITKNKFLALSGDASDMYHFKKWVNKKCPKFELESHGENSIGLIFSYKKLKMIWFSEGYPHKIPKELGAIGSGEQFAMGAMVNGASPFKAIKLIIEKRLDNATGLGIDYFLINKEGIKKLKTWKHKND